MPSTVARNALGSIGVVGFARLEAKHDERLVGRERAAARGVGDHDGRRSELENQAARGEGQCGARQRGRGGERRGEGIPPGKGNA